MQPPTYPLPLRYPKTNLQYTLETAIQAVYKLEAFDHALINRHLIKPLLQQLLASTVVCHVEGMSRDEQYQQLLQQTNLNSEFERVVSQEIYQQGYKLPDTAQKLIPQANSKPDFFYRDALCSYFL